MQTLVIGLDGVCLSVLEPLMDEDVVPTLAEIRSGGAAGPLRSQLPPWTPSAWPSMYTGVNPGKHGVYSFLHFDGYDWDVVNRSHVKEFAVWELLSMNGFSSVVLNVPATHPPREFDGVLVPGYIAPEGAACHPSGVWTELQEELGGYSLYANTLRANASDGGLAEGLSRLTRMRGDAFRYLVEKHDPDFGFVQFQATDTVYHQFPGDEAVIRGVYSAVDHEVSQILDACNPDLTLVVSDHGLGSIDGREFRVNEYLRENGYVATTTGSGMPSWKSLAADETENAGWTDAAESLAAKTLEQAARIGITSQRIGAVLRRLGVEDRVLETVPIDLVRAGTEQTDFAASTAYMRVRTEMGVRLNLEGREPDGVVSPENYEQIRTELMKALEGVMTPEGDPVFEAVYRREAVFDGPYVDDAPDIVTVPNRFDHFLVATHKGATFGDPTEPWEHKRDGVVMATGDDIDPETNLDGAHLFDVTPTILTSFGLPVGERMDGGPLSVVDSAARTTYPSFSPAETVATDDVAVEDRLSDLGYLE
ncbi:alkaline phosphatase family protein [Haloarcula marina]|uniref:alkaline phosphatase family protein n=1 Tax=Haloarcula marina TaxID=2961574 RepID=UPI0020B7D60C|nr:alkaline phosphatase family protein [Halomicroarcula marina]